MSFKRTSSTTPSLKKFSVSDREVLNKRVQSNPRYAKVKPKTNTGFNAKRKEEIEKEIRKYYKVRNDEIFQRISLGDFLQLMLAFVEECKDENQEEEENSHAPQDSANHMQNQNTLDSPKKGTLSTAFMDEVEDLPKKIEKSKQSPFLLLDVRTASEYREAHLATALWYSHSKMSRALGWETQEMLSYKNHPEWIIIIYDECENLAPDVASTLIHRGYSNIFMLSGGLRLAQDKMGPPLVTQEQTRNISDKVAEFIAERLIFINLPPLLLQEAAEWWTASNTDVFHHGASSVLNSPNGIQHVHSRNPVAMESPHKKPWR